MTKMTHNFIRGAGSVLDLLPSHGGSHVGRGLDLNRTDAQALQQDWQQVAQDFRQALDKTALETGVNVQAKQKK